MGQLWPTLPRNNSAEAATSEASPTSRKNISVRCETKTRLGLQSSCADNNRRQRLGVHGSRIKSQRGGGGIRGRQPGTHLHLIQLWLDVWREVCRTAGERIERLGAKQVFICQENTSARKQEVSSTDATAAAPWRATKANADGQRGQYASNINGYRITFFSVSQKIYEKNVIISFTRIVLYLNM